MKQERLYKDTVPSGDYPVYIIIHIGLFPFGPHFGRSEAPSDLPPPGRDRASPRKNKRPEEEEEPAKSERERHIMQIRQFFGGPPLFSPCECVCVLCIVEDQSVCVQASRPLLLVYFASGSVKNGLAEERINTGGRGGCKNRAIYGH